MALVTISVTGFAPYLGTEKGLLNFFRRCIMSENQSHKRAKAKAPGKSEVPISRNRRLDSATKKTATEIERNSQNLEKAVNRLRDSGRPRRVLQVPQNLMPDASKLMRQKGVGGTVKNLSGTRRISIPKKK